MKLKEIIMNKDYVLGRNFIFPRQCGVTTMLANLADVISMNGYVCYVTSNAKNVETVKNRLNRDSKVAVKTMNQLNKTSRQKYDYYIFDNIEFTDVEIILDNNYIEILTQ